MLDMHPRRGASAGIVVLIIVLVGVVIAAGAFYLTWEDGRAEMAAQEQTQPGYISLEQIQKAGEWASAPIQNAISSNGTIPTDEEGNALMASLKDPPYVDPKLQLVLKPTYHRVSDEVYEVHFPGNQKDAQLVMPFSKTGDLLEPLAGQKFMDQMGQTASPIDPVDT